MNADTIATHEVREIIARPPSGLMNYGTGTIVFFMVAAFTLSYFIEYSDVIVGTAKLSTANVPIKMVTKLPAEVESICVPGNNMVDSGAVIVKLKSNASHSDCEELLNLLTTPVSVEKFVQNILHTKPELKLGNLSTEWGNLIITAKEIAYYQSNQYDQITLQSLQQQLNIIKQQIKITKAQADSAMVEYNRALDKLKRHQALYKEGLISYDQLLSIENNTIQAANTHRNYQLNLLASENTIKTIEQNILSNESNTTFRTFDKSQQLEQSRNTLIRMLNEYFSNYYLSAPCKGLVSYSNFLHANQYLNVGEEVCTILPKIRQLTLYTTISANALGRVEKDQKVRIYLNNYPRNEYGYLTGQVTFISPIIREDAYEVKISLSEDLVTNFGKRITFGQELAGTVEIITSKKSVLNRIFEKYLYLIRGKAT